MDDTAKRIWLPRLPAFKENTFCVDQADTDTVEYVRADLHQKALDHIEALEDEVERLREIIDEAVNCPEPDHHCPAFRHVVMCVLASAIVEQEKSDDRA